MKAPAGADDDDERSDYKLLTRRQQQTLKVQILQTPDAWSVDVGQGIGRSPHRCDEMFNSFTTTAVPYIVSQNRILFGKECLLVHGYPREPLAKDALDNANIKDTTLKDLAANSFSSGACTAVLIAVLSVLPSRLWCADPTETASSSHCDGDPGNDPTELVDSILEM